MIFKFTVLKKVLILMRRVVPTNYIVNDKKSKTMRQKIEKWCLSTLGHRSRSCAPSCHGCSKWMHLHFFASSARFYKFDALQRLFVLKIEKKFSFRRFWPRKWRHSPFRGCIYKSPYNSGIAHLKRGGLSVW